MILLSVSAQHFPTILFSLSSQPPTLHRCQHVQIQPDEVLLYNEPCLPLPAILAPQNIPLFSPLHTYSYHVPHYFLPSILNLVIKMIQIVMMNHVFHPHDVVDLLMRAVIELYFILCKMLKIDQFNNQVSNISDDLGMRLNPLHPSSNPLSFYSMIDPTIGHIFSYKK